MHKISFPKFISAITTALLSDFSKETKIKKSMQSCIFTVSFKIFSLFNHFKKFIRICQLNKH